MKIEGNCKYGAAACRNLVQPYEKNGCHKCRVSGVPIAGMDKCPMGMSQFDWLNKKPKQLKLGSLAPYRVEKSVGREFCKTCKRGVMWEVLTPEDQYLSQSWEDKDEAEWVCDQLNTAYKLGEDSMVDK